MSEVFRSSDNQIIAVGIENTLHWFDGMTFKEMGSFQLRLDGIMSIRFSADNHLVGVESGVSKAQIFDIYDQHVLATLTGLNGPISDLSFTPDNSYAVFLMVDVRNGDSIGLWDIRADKLERVFAVGEPDEPHRMSGPVISPDGTLLAAGCDKQVYIWDLTNGQIKFILDGHTESITNVDFSPDGKMLASGSWDHTVRLWDPVVGELVQVISDIPGITFGITVKFSSDGDDLVINNSAWPIGIWNLKEQKLSPILPLQAVTPDPFAVEMHHHGYSQNWLPSTSGEVLFSPDGNYLALGSEPILLWDIGKQTVTTSLEGIHNSSITNMQYSPSGQWLAALDDIKNLRVWDVQSNKIQIQRESEFFTGDETRGNPSVFTFSPDNALLALNNRNTIEIWDVVHATQLFIIQLDQGVQGVDNLTFSPDGNRLYTFLYSNEMRVAETWDINEQKLLHHFEIKIPEPTSYVTGANDTHWPYYARNNADQNQSWIEIWNLETGKITFQLTTPRPETEPIQFSPDGSLLMAISNGCLYVWNIATGETVFMIEQVPLTAGIAISSDSKMLAIERYGRVDLWDISQVTKDSAKH